GGEMQETEEFHVRSPRLNTTPTSGLSSARLFYLQTRQHPRHQQWQILADQAGTAEAVGRFGMEPDGSAGGVPACHALPHQSGDHAGQYVARTGSAEPGGGIGVDSGAAI